jgi:deazaflavin-dependent oxidoreductase (nitroreductase family)
MPADLDQPAPTAMPASQARDPASPAVVPRWLVRTIWKLHRAAYAITGGRFGLRAPAPGRWGMLRITTVGRRTGRRRTAILGYLEDGPNLITPAMNGWADPEPAWWLNLQAHPEAVVTLSEGSRAVAARAADPDERRRLWARFVALGSSAYTDANAALRSRETAIVILEPRPDRRT